MDKAMTKKLCMQAGLPVVEHLSLTRGEFDAKNLRLPFDFPVFVKPANLGSFVGITKAKTCCELDKALEIASQYDRKLVVERGVNGRRIRVRRARRRSTQGRYALRNHPFAGILYLRR